MKEYLWTLDGGRLQYQSSYADSELNWLFLPGGPGLGSEAFAGLTQLLKHKIPGTIWHFDLPNDGSNILVDKPLSLWRNALIQAVSAFEKVIVVAHSTSGMYIQTLPELEEMLEGMVLIGSAPEASWQKIFKQYCQKNTDLFIKDAEKEYRDSSNNENLRKLLMACAKYCFSTEKSIKQGQILFKNLPINNEASEWSSNNFDSENYKSLWIPKTLPCLIMAGLEDHITPLHLFKDNRAYQRVNILIEEISGAGHYPWFENQLDILKAFEKFCLLLDCRKIK